MRTSDGESAAAARVHQIQEGEQLHAGALACRRGRFPPAGRRRLGPGRSCGCPPSSASTAAASADSSTSASSSGCRLPITSDVFSPVSSHWGLGRASRFQAPPSRAPAAQEGATRHRARDARPRPITGPSRRKMPTRLNAARCSAVRVKLLVTGKSPARRVPTAIGQTGYQEHSRDRAPARCFIRGGKCSWYSRHSLQM
jgi:hypothetical protein